MSLASRAAGRPWLIAAWAALAGLSALLGIAYILGEKQLFTPGGWFALDGRRLLEASSAWLAGGDPYAVKGFVYSPVALILAAPWTLLPPTVAIVSWIATSAGLAVIAVVRVLGDLPWWQVLIAVVAVLGFLSTLADLALANVTIALVVAFVPIVRTNGFKSGIMFGVLAAAFPKPLVIPILLWAVVWRRQAAAGVVTAGLATSALAVLVAGPTTTVAFLSTLASGGGISYEFLGNYGISLFSPPLALAVGALSAAAFVIVVFRRGPIVTLAWAAAVGVLIAPYAGIYASLPMLVALPGVASITPGGALLSALFIVVVAPWSPISAIALMAFTLIVPTGKDPGRRRASDITVP